VRILSQLDRNGKAKDIGFDSLARIELTRAHSAGRDESRSLNEA
jgi:hypothetical protein